MTRQNTKLIDLLIEKIKDQKTEELISFITQNPGVLNEKDRNNSSGFLLIAYSNISSVFKKAIALKQTFNFQEAILSGKIDIVKSFVEKDKNKVHEYSSDGFTPIALASFFDQTAIAEYLLEQGANPGLAAKNPSKVNALHAAVAKENITLCRLFIENRIDVNSTQIQNVTPLHSAVHRGNLPLVKLLIANGADITLKMDNGDDALTIAKRDKHNEILNFLIEKN
ncbi:hypothetical protein GTQ40_12935 [Flavobacteriaceae bacterium R38]|nr:hypothetical protein [Flavobacteriaceae bacterium R38]